MKHLFIVLIATSLTGCASFIPAEIENDKILGIIPIQYGLGSYQATYKVNASREDIFRQVRRWAAFHATTTVTTPYGLPLKINTPTTAFNISDNMLGDVISSGVINGGPSDYKTVMYWPGGSYSTRVECYEGYFRVTITNIKLYGVPAYHAIELRDRSTPIR